MIKFIDMNVHNSYILTIMNVHEINRSLLLGLGSLEPLLPNWFGLKSSRICFPIHFGLETMPEDPGLLVIRGARQYGKSTWLEGEIVKSFDTYGPGTTFYLNGDRIADNQELELEIARLVRQFSPTAKVKRIFIDEISAIENWQNAIKILWDSGLTRQVLIVTTGSKATDLRRGAEMLPGRKGTLERSNYLFTPLSFGNFYREATSYLDSKEDAIAAYILSGGSPLCCQTLLTTGHIPPYLIQMVKDWILGSFATAGRARANVISMIDSLCRFAMNPTSQNKIARESGLANNTSTAQYVEQLMDLLCLAQADNYDPQKNRRNVRKPAKYHFVNTLVPVAFGCDELSSVANFKALTSTQRGKWFEWIVAQELWRRDAIRGVENPEFMRFWQSKTNEIDFLSPREGYIEVKSGPIDPRDFDWFNLSFPKQKLTVIGDQTAAFGKINCMSLFDFLNQL